jgi:Pyruvate/2-oxoacid:ferredoxin oxidoreductase gamma subunit
MIGAMSQVCGLPIDRKDFEKVISETLPTGKVDLNLRAFDMGSELVKP